MKNKKMHKKVSQPLRLSPIQNIKMKNQSKCLIENLKMKNKLKIINNQSISIIKFLNNNRKLKNKIIH